MKKLLVIVTSFLLLNFGTAFAFSTLVQLDPTGASSYSITGIAEFDWNSIGNLLIEDSLIASSSPTATTYTSLNAWLLAGEADSTATFNIHGQAQLGNYIFFGTGSDASGQDLYNNADPTGDYEITLTLDAIEKATMTINGVTGNRELVFTDITGSFQYYLDITPDSDPYTGNGFNNGDPAAADPFLWGTLDSVSGDFEIVTPGTEGGGKSYISSTIAGYNSAYIQTDPANVGVNLIGSTLEATVEYRTAFSPNPSSVGNVPYTVTQGDLMLIADANSTFEASAIPEPATIMLLGFGLISIAAIGRRKN